MEVQWRSEEAGWRTQQAAGGVVVEDALEQHAPRRLQLREWRAPARQVAAALALLRRRAVGPLWRAEEIWQGLARVGGIGGDWTRSGEDETCSKRPCSCLKTSLQKREWSSAVSPPWPTAVGGGGRAQALGGHERVCEIAGKMNLVDGGLGAAVGAQEGDERAPPQLPWPHAAFLARAQRTEEVEGGGDDGGALHPQVPRFVLDVVAPGHGDTAAVRRLTWGADA